MRYIRIISLQVYPVLMTIVLKKDILVRVLEF